MSDELQELQEHAEHARHNPNLAPVSLTMAILAVLVATATLLGHRAHTEEVILQNKVSDQWNYFQAKKLRGHQDELFADLSGFVATRSPDEAAKFQKKYQSEASRYADDQTKAQADAEKLQGGQEKERHRANRYDLAEVFMDIALVITSITLLSGRMSFWHTGIVLGIVGIVVACSGLLIH